MVKTDYWKPSVATDCVVFTIEDDALKLLLIRRGIEPFKGKWALPGGFLAEGESLDDCARRELAEETGVKDIYLEQLYSFGAPDRDPRSRVISVAYMALMRAGTRTAAAGSDAESVGWHKAAALPPLAFDHREIVTMARKRLASKLAYSSIAFQLLPPSFTLSELQRVYEIIKGEDLDKRNFRKWIDGLGLVEETGEKRQEGAHRPAALYRAVNTKRVDYFG